MHVMIIGPTELRDAIQHLADLLQKNVRCDERYNYAAYGGLGRNIADTIRTADVIVHVTCEVTTPKSPWVLEELQRARDLGKLIVEVASNTLRDDPIPQELQNLIAEARTHPKTEWPSAYRFEEQPEPAVVPQHRRADLAIVRDLFKNPGHRQAAESTLNADAIAWNYGYAEAVSPNSIKDYASQLSDPRLKRRVEELWRELGPDGAKSYVLSVIEAVLRPVTDDDGDEKMPFSY